MSALTRTLGNVGGYHVSLITMVEARIAKLEQAPDLFAAELASLRQERDIYVETLPTALRHQEIKRAQRAVKAGREK